MTSRTTAIDSGPSIFTYTVVWIFLIALTVLTVGISFMPLSSAAHISVGLTIGLIKATLVGLFFMHLINSPRLIWIIVAMAVLWLLIMTSLNFTDYMTRGLVPAMPGH
jgi:cytochrome c oxidase subunit IV